MKFIVVVLALFLSVSCVTVVRTWGNGVYLGERTVDFDNDHAVIQVGGYDGFFKALTFRAQRNAVEIYQIVVVYGNGERENLAADLVLTPGEGPLLVHLDGRRKIRVVDFSYRTVGNWHRGRSIVTVWGVR